MSAALELVRSTMRDGLRIEPRQSVSEWADTHRMLSSETCAEPGPWRTSRVPYMLEVMDSLGADDPVQRVVLMKAAQVSGTEVALNLIGYAIACDPGPTMIVEPRGDDAKALSKERVAPMIDASPVLRSLVAENRSKDSGNTILVKEFVGGLLVVTGANSAAGLRSRPVRRLIADELDAYPLDVDGEGDPLSLAEKRMTTFSRRKEFILSTPTTKGVSRIEREFLSGDQRRYHVPCPHCGRFDWMRWSNLRWEDGRPGTAALMCEGCGVLIEERYKSQMLMAGKWVASSPGDGRTRSYHISGLYSPLGWLSWADIVTEFLAAKEDPSLLRVWVNTRLGETWEERGDSIEPDGVVARAERYAAEVPNGVGILVASVDVQGDRLECAVKGYGSAEESWLIAYSQFHGDPARDQVWFDLDAFLLGKFTHESGQQVAIDCVTVDSGGHHSDQVYRFCKARQGRRVYAVRGGALSGKPLVDRPTTNNAYRAKLFTLCVDTGKETVYSRLLINAPGPGYMHMPEWIDAEYAAQLTAEKALRKYVKGRGSVRVWKKTRERNEALDLEVYCLAALNILGPTLIRSLPQRAARLASTTPGQAVSTDVPAEPSAAPMARPAPVRRRAGGWMSGI